MFVSSDLILHRIIPFPPLLPSTVLDRVNTVCVKYNFTSSKSFVIFKMQLLKYALIYFTVSTDNTFADIF